MLLGIFPFGFKIITQTAFQMPQCKSVLINLNPTLNKIQIRMALLLSQILLAKGGQIPAHHQFQQLPQHVPMTVNQIAVQYN